MRERNCAKILAVLIQIQSIMTSFLAEDCNVISVDWRDLAGPAPWYDVIRQVRVNPKEKPYNYRALLLISRKN